MQHRMAWHGGGGTDGGAFDTSRLVATGASPAIGSVHPLHPRVFHPDLRASIASFLAEEVTV